MEPDSDMHDDIYEGYVAQIPEVGTTISNSLTRALHR